LAKTPKRSSDSGRLRMHQSEQVSLHCGRLILAQCTLTQTALTSACPGKGAHGQSVINVRDEFFYAEQGVDMPKMVKSRTHWSGHGVHTTTNARGFEVVTAEPPRMGGTDKGMTPLELLLAALGSCTTTMVAMFAEQVGVDLRAAHMEVEGDLDPAGFAGMDPNAPVGFSQIRATLTIESPSPREKVEELARLAVERCPVTSTLHGVELVSKHVLVVDGR